ncbi:MAG TPA: hypothetical protein VI729_09960 [Anaerolineales bacterium]|nr:hypothetical protein [Anaerolineales bacterium]
MTFLSFRKIGVVDVAPAVPSPGATGAKPPGTAKTTASNLLAHIPGEASGFYLLWVGALTEPTLVELGILFVISVALLVVVRMLAKASALLIVSSLVAFAIWMFVVDNGLFKVWFQLPIQEMLLLAIAAAYSTLITLLANAGILK